MDVHLSTVFYMNCALCSGSALCLGRALWLSFVLCLDCLVEWHGELMKRVAGIKDQSVK